MGNGQFVWYDLGTTDKDAAKAFYGAVLGWDGEDVPALHYTVFKSAGVPAAGLMVLPDHLQQAGTPPHWLGYIGVDDVDAAAERITGAGGQVRHTPTDIPDVGRFAVLADPQGAVFAVFRGNADAPPVPPMSPGHVAWRELVTTDREASVRFYFDLFGWTAGEAHEFGPAGTYQIFNYDGLSRGGIMRAPEGMRPGWLFYFAVNGIDEAVRRVQNAGGVVFFGPQEVPGGAWIINARDPQGAFFGLVSGTR